MLSLALLLASAGATELESVPEPPTCPPAEEMLDGHRLLRAISLDLRGVVPSPEEFARLDGDDVPEDLVDAWLDTEAFAERAVRTHRALLWNNVDKLSLVSTNNMFTSTGGVYYIRNRSDDYRDDGNGYCGDFPATFDGQGRPVPNVLPDGTLQEGWVEVEPYWAPGETWKVCAYDAQEAAVSPLGTDCASNAAATDTACGCGPNLQWCSISTAEDEVARAMSKEIDQRIRDVILTDKPYVDILTGRTAFVNGPLVHYYTHLTQVPSTVRLDNNPMHPEELPPLDWSDEAWTQVSLPEGHSGVLTAPGFLLRFQTNRARANRFYNAFLCQPFQPPDAGIPIDPDAPPTANLMKTQGCDYCHAILEPAAAHWGRWTQQGAGYLDPELYPGFDQACFDCSANNTDCSDVCGRYYTVDPIDSELDPFVGYLSAYQFLETWQQAHVESGPELLVASTIADGRLQQCAAENAATWLLGRPVDVDDDAVIQGWADGFVASGWSYKELVKSIVLSDSYRRIR